MTRSVGIFEFVLLLLPASCGGMLSQPDASSDGGASDGDSGNGVRVIVSGECPIRLATDDASIYWTTQCAPCGDDGGTGSVMRIAASGVGPAATVATSDKGVVGLTVTEGRAYWLDQCGDSIRSCPVDGCLADPDVAATGATGQTLIADAGRIWWFRANGDLVTCPATDCSSPDVVASGVGSAPGELALDETNVYWSTGYDLETIFSCPKTANCGGNPTVVASNQQFLSRFAVASGTLYWTVNTAVMACAALGCNQQPTLVIADNGVPFGVAIWDDRLYWTSLAAGSLPNPGALYECQAAACVASTPVASSLANPRDILATPFGVFWLTRDAVMLATK